MNDDQKKTPKRPPIGTQVKHAKYGKGKIFSYQNCDEFGCGVEFPKKGRWCIDLRELTVLPNNKEWLGACDWCDTKQAMGNGKAKMGVNSLRVLLWCEKCQEKTVHRFPLSETKYAAGDKVEICDGSGIHGYKAKVLWVQDDEKMIVELEKFGLCPVTKKEVKPWKNKQHE